MSDLDKENLFRNRKYEVMRGFRKDLIHEHQPGQRRTRILSR